MATEGGATTAHIVVMGVSGSGKTVLASLIAGRLGFEFCEADSFHPASNVEKMSQGTPLTDEDRAPWLEALAKWMADQAAAGRSTVMACSALKRTYRDVLRSGGGEVAFIHLEGDPDLITERMKAREHFMPSSLLQSQLDTLEPLQADELGISVSLHQAPESELSQSLDWLRSRLL